MMATRGRPTLDPATARTVIDPASYAAWDPLLDTFDRLREEKPVVWVEPQDDHAHRPSGWSPVITTSCGCRRTMRPS